MKPVAWICLLFFSVALSASAQKIKPDTAFLAASVNFAVDQYAKQLKGESPLHNGIEYGEYTSLQEEHPFFLNNDWMEGSIIYQNDYYNKVPLQFDISADKVITEHATSGAKIQLINSKITAFTINNHRFIKLQAKSGDTLKLTPGFYEMLTEGPHLTLLTKRLKTLQRKVEANETRAEFEEVNRYYYSKNGRYYPVKSKKSALQPLTDRRSQVKQYLKKNKIRFGVTRENALIEIAKFYNTIKNQE
jgi:hypothetical protein